MGSPVTVLFVCLHGSGKSLIAKEYFRRLAAQRGLDVRAASAGPDPDAEVPPKVVQGLLADGIDVRGYQPRRLTQEELAGASRVISLGCNLGDLAPAGLTVERWDDISEVRADFSAARDLVLARLPALLANVRDSQVPPRVHRRME